MSFTQQQGEGNSHEAARREGTGPEELGWGQHAPCALSCTQLILLASPHQPHFWLQACLAAPQSCVGASAPTAANCLGQRCPSDWKDQVSGGSILIH